jgi:serine/threonine-protein kinase
MSTPSLPDVGDVIADKYRIDGQLGEGGMAVVFSAHHTLLDKPIAVKILSPDLPHTATIIERFLTEARAAAKVDCANVARVMDVGTLKSGLPYIVMERLDGCDLEELLRLEKQLAIGDAVDYVLQALAGLAHAHTLGIIHRDLKPANLFLAHQPDGTSIIKILDFGIAKLDHGNRMTKAGQAVGSPTYMSPEHIRASEHLDHRTDIWAMGVVLYELLAGEPPIEEDGVGETIAAVLAKKAPGVRTKRPEVPEQLEAAIMKCLQHDPNDRWPDVAAYARAIAPFGTGACAMIPDAIEQTLRQQLRRYSGQAMLIRPMTPNAMPNAVTLPAVPSPSTTQEAPAVTEDSVPELRPRRTGLWVGLAVIGTAAATYLLLVNGHLLQKLRPSAPPDTGATTSVAAASVEPTASSSAIHAKPPTTTSHHHGSPSATPSTSATTKKHH